MRWRGREELSYLNTPEPSRTRNRHANDDEGADDIAPTVLSAAKRVPLPATDPSGEHLRLAAERLEKVAARINPFRLKSSSQYTAATNKLHPRNRVARRHFGRSHATMAIRSELLSVARIQEAPADGKLRQGGKPVESLGASRAQPASVVGRGDRGDASSPPSLASRGVGIRWPSGEAEFFYVASAVRPRLLAFRAAWSNSRQYCGPDRGSAGSSAPIRRGR